jgi:hypothetical protein
MTLREPFPLENIGAVYNARDYRALFKRLFGDRPGIFRDTDLAVTEQGVPAMGVTVAAGGGLVDATGAGIDGLYFVDNDAPVNVALAAADAVNPRRDIIGIRVRDSESAGADNDGAIVAVTGTPAAVPADPALPSNFLVLARVAVAALAANIVNANITDLRRTTAGQGGLVTAAGGTIICTSTTRPTVGLVVGQAIYETDTDKTLRWSGAAWVPGLARIPHTDTGGATSAGATTTSGSFVNLGVRARVLGFAKARADTKLVVHYHGSITNDNGLGEFEVAALVNGVDNVIGHGFGSADNRSGVIAITGLAVGAYDVEIRKRRPNGVGNVTDGNAGARTLLSVTETF